MADTPIRVVFLGTPEFAVPSLEALITRPEFDVCGVVTQPDRPAGRGQQVASSAVNQAAERADIPLFQPETLRDPAAVETLQGWSPDVMVVAAYGQILRKPVLEMPPFGCINVHASLLPRWRGAAPIQYALRAGDSQTGITIMKMDPGLDTGPMLAAHVVPIAPDETASTLHDKLARAAADFLPDILLDYLKGDVKPRPQPDEGVTHAPTLKKAEGQIDWAQPAEAIDRHVRAFTPWPGTFTRLAGELLRVLKGKPLPGETGRGAPGTVVLRENLLVVQTGSGLYAIEEIQPAGKQKMTSLSFANGRRGLNGALFGSSE